MGAGTLQKFRSFIYQGNGFLKNKAVSLHEVFLMSDGSYLTTTTSTNPGFTKVDTNALALVWAADKVVEAGLNIQVPDDYDKAKDHLKLKIKCVSAGTDAPKIGTVAYLDSDSTTDLGPDDTAAASTSLRWLEVDLSGNSLEAGDTLTLGLTPAAHSSHALHVYAMKLEYRSTLVYADRSATR